MITRLLARGSLVAVLAVAVAASIPSEPDGPFAAIDAATYDAPVVALTPSFFSDCGHCDNVCGGGRHNFDNFEMGSAVSWGEADHSCAPPIAFGSCTIAHGGNGQCNAEEDEDVAALREEQARELWLTASTGETGSLLSVVNRLGSAAVFAAERQAIQVLSCDGEPFVSIPLTETQSQALAAQQ